MRRRGEFAERSFAHVLDSGGARRTTLRGRANISKRYLIQAACLNLSILLRQVTGLGTLKQTWAASRQARALCSHVWQEWHRSLRSLTLLHGPMDHVQLLPAHPTHSLLQVG
jgi:hypothetical protein